MSKIHWLALLLSLAVTPLALAGNGDKTDAKTVKQGNVKNVKGDKPVAKDVKHAKGQKKAKQGAVKKIQRDKSLDAKTAKKASAKDLQPAKKRKDGREAERALAKQAKHEQAKRAKAQLATVKKQPQAKNAKLKQGVKDAHAKQDKTPSKSAQKAAKQVKQQKQKNPKDSQKTDKKPRGEEAGKFPTK